MTQEDRDKFITMQLDLDHIKEDVKDTNATVKQFSKDFQRLTFHIFGDSETNSKGLIEDFSKVKIRLSRVEKFYTAIAFIGGIIMAWIGKKLL